MSLFCKFVDSPVGRLKLVASAQGLAAVLWDGDPPARVPLESPGEDTEHTILLETEQQLSAYFAGTRTSFTVPLAIRGTAFQKEVWGALQEIPFGETRSYGEIALQLGKPAASRAVGAANGRNPLSIIVPCHRVVGTSGKLTGFAGGLHVKEFLLSLEGATGRLF